MNYKRMTIRKNGEGFAVFAMKRQTIGYATDMASNRAVYAVSAVAKPRFVGTYAECLDFIRSAGAEFMTEHGIPA